ncbi:resolvase, Holliday junction-type [Methanocaldococcus villosus KIN24-T80]|uniref:Crossover junction endodeoxyribonuclease Hjc n=1 Tax=Methanocaldococcus villosus KIN24-T80 TaxID=1069083 RepID=N6UUT7_9EURY|nr:Holliday junction resolvase Hjc [Methanocaldococcus villosus]ENN96109.1 resolvase, Holliday junction-type [Methanocaldococcus villosus KIN24-T80]
MSYKKGSSFERKLKELLEKEGFAVIRSAGSKGIDLIAGKNGKILIFECKSSNKNRFYINREDVEKLIKFSEIFGGKPYLAVKMQRKIFFIDPYLLSTNKKSFVIDKNIENFSLTFYDIIR